MKFREFINKKDQVTHNSEEIENVRTLLNKLPKSHRSLVKGFDWKFQAGNTLNGDDEHVGYMDEKDKEIAVAAPWNYGREFTILHEISHRVWERLSPELQDKWGKIAKRTKDKQSQSAEELFCMAYANHYVKNKMVIHDHPEWHEFIQNLPK